MGGFVIFFVNVDSYSGVPSCTFESWLNGNFLMHVLRCLMIAVDICSSKPSFKKDGISCHNLLVIKI